MGPVPLSPFLFSGLELRRRPGSARLPDPPIRRSCSFSTRDEGRDENAPAGFRSVAPRSSRGDRSHGPAPAAELRRNKLGKKQARSSGGEHYLDTVGVSGSNPLEPTNSSRRRR